jgi:uncharacterized repeat protein (TIGR01451 family)
MTPRPRASGALAFALALAVWLLGLLVATPAAACTAGGCVSAGPRLASVSSTRAPLLNALFSTLGGGTVNLTAADWNTVAAGDVSLVKTLSALQVATNTSTPAAALAANATVAQVVGAMATAAQGDGQTSLAAALGTLQTQVALPSTVRLGDLLTTSGPLGTTRINALSAATGTLQLYNKQNVATTPQAIGLTGSALGLGGVLNAATVQAQVVEAPVYVCGSAGSAFHTASVRVKLHLDLVALNLNLGVLNTSASVGQLDLYLEIGRADGVIGTVDAIANALTVQVAPGVADLYLGTIADTVFFNRARALVASDVTPGSIGSLSLLGTTVAIRAKSIAKGQAPSTTTLAFSGAGLQTRTAYTSAGFGANLFGSLVDNLQLSLQPTGVLDSLLGALAPVLTSTLKPVLTTVLTGLVDPLLETLGIRVGEVDVTSGGTALACTVSGRVYNDANHNARLDGAESGTGATLYAKLVATATPTVASAVVAVDPATGTYAFASVAPASYLVVVSTDGTAGQVGAAGPAGWIATETPTLSRAVTIAAADATALRFGLYRGSRLSGTVVRDTGTGTGGVAHNAVRDGTETGIAGAVVNLTDATGTTTHDTTTTDAQGAYTLWVPFSTQGASLRVTQPADPTLWVSVSGSAGTTGGAYALATDAVTFTHASGSTYTGVVFGDVPPNRFDTDGQRAVAPGATVHYAHAFQAGSAGQLGLSVQPIGTVPAGWSAVAFVDAACNGQLEGADTPVSAPIPVVADQKVCVVVKVFAPANAPVGARASFAVVASFAYANNALVLALQRQDVATVGGENGLQLVKTVDRAAAALGDVLVYTIVFANDGSGAVTALKIRDATPPYTVFVAAACPVLPAGLACSVTQQPAAGAAGTVEWTLTGALASAGRGSVTLSVKLQ